jgi:hypothetical protein
MPLFFQKLRKWFRAFLFFRGSLFFGGFALGLLFF